MPLPDLRLRVFVPALLGSCVLALSFASVAAAAKSKSVPSQVRVVDSDGSSLAQQTQYLGGDVRIKTDPKASCFGPGTGGSGAKVKVGGSTALGQLAEAGRTDRDIRPLSISDAFDFGLALCGIGKAVSPDTGFWYLKVNNEASQTGGDLTEVGKGDAILWFLIEDFNDPVPDELALKAPNVGAPVDAFEVQVLTYSDSGKRKPARGATVAGAAEPTDSKGRTLVEADKRLLEVSATRDGAIPSNEVVVCTVAASKCPPGYAETVSGTKGDDRIVAGKRAETILAGGGDDKIDATRGTAPDLIKCGGGDDRVTISRAAERRSKLRGCERVVTRFK